VNLTTSKYTYIRNIKLRFLCLILNLQIEKSPTLGSINTTDYEKRKLAVQSLEFNLKNKMFCELFPETVEVLFYYTTEHPYKLNINQLVYD